MYIIKIGLHVQFVFSILGSIVSLIGGTYVAFLWLTVSEL